LVHKGNISAVKSAVFISDKMSYIKLRVRSCDIVVMIVHASPEYKGDI